MRTAPRSDPGYVRHLFDQFSADYENRMLGHLHYSAHETLYASLPVWWRLGRKGLRHIWTPAVAPGLAGALFKPDAVRLDGIDLSPPDDREGLARGEFTIRSPSKDIWKLHLRVRVHAMI